MIDNDWVKEQRVVYFENSTLEGSNGGGFNNLFWEEAPWFLSVSFNFFSQTTSTTRGGVFTTSI